MVPRLSQVIHSDVTQAKRAEKETGGKMGLLQKQRTEACSDLLSA